MSLSVVQSAGTEYNATFTGTPHSNWGVAPTNGNLLIAIGFTRNNNTPAGANGWKVYTTSATSSFFITVYYKYAASTSSSEQIDTTTTSNDWGFTFWEIAGVTGHLWADLINVTFGVQNGSATSMAAGSITTRNSTSLLLSAFAGGTSNSGSTFDWSGNTGWTKDVGVISATTSGVGVFDWATGGHRAVSGNTSYSSTVVASASVAAWVSAYVELGSSTVPNADGPGAMGVAGSTIASPGSISTTVSPIGTSGSDVFVVTALMNSASSPGTATPTISDDHTLTWTLRTSYSSGNSRFWAWWAKSVSAITPVVTVSIANSSASGATALSLTGQSIGGCGSLTSPFDPNVSFPFANAGNPSWTTTNPHDLIYAVAFNIVSSAAAGAPTGYEELVQAFENFSGTFSQQQTSINPQDASGAGSITYNVAYLDAFTAGSGESGSVALALAGVGFNVSAADTTFANKHASLALTKASFSGTGAREETANANLALAKASFSAQAHRQESGNVALALSGVAISAAAIDLGAAGSGAVHFATFGA